MKIRSLLYTLFLTVLALPAFSQSADQPWSLQQCIDYALKNNLQVQSARLSVLSGQAGKWTALGNRLPSLNANTNFQYSVGRSINNFTNQFETEPVSVQTFGLNSSVPLFTGFTNQNLQKQAKQNYIAAEQGLETTNNLVIINILIFYNNILFNAELLKNARIQVQSTEALLEKTTQQLAVGEIARNGVLLVEQQLASEKLAVVSAENGLKLAVLNMKQALQLPGDQEFQVQIPQLSNPGSYSLPGTVNAVYDAAEANQPSIKQAEAQKEAARYGLQAAKGGFWPSIFLSGGISTLYSSVAPSVIPVTGADNIQVIQQIGFVNDVNSTPVLAVANLPAEFKENTYTNQLDFNLNYFVSVSLNIPIFNGFQNKANVANARVGLEQAQINEENG